jgi:transposase InsO family protein
LLFGKRHGSRVPQVEGDKPTRKAFKSHPIGYFHIDIAEARTAQGKLYLFVAIDRTSKFALVRVEENATVETATAFLQEPIHSLPYRIHTVLTDNGIQFGDLPSRRNGPTASLRMHLFDRTCIANGIEHRTTKPNYPWANGQVERMNRTINEATVKCYHYDSHGQFGQHLQDFIDAYNFACRLKTLKGLTPY